MALLTKTGVENLLRRIMETGGLTESMSDDIQRLRDDFAEREGILNRYGESYDGEDEEYEWREREPESRDVASGREGSGEASRDDAERTDTDRDEARTTVQTTDANGAPGVVTPLDGDTVIVSEEDWKSKYETLRKQYIDRFFGGDQAFAKAEEIYREQEEDVKRDGTVQSFAELFERAEGDKPTGRR